MTTFCLITLALLIPWLLVGLVIAVMDARIRREQSMALDTRAWQEKVDAMRRIHEQEGDA